MGCKKYDCVQGVDRTTAKKQRSLVKRMKVKVIILLSVLYRYLSKFWRPLLFLPLMTSKNYNVISFLFILQSATDIRFIEGKKRNKNKEEVTQDGQVEDVDEDKKEEGAHPFQRSRPLVQTTKKVNCPAQIIIRDIVAFPEFKV